MQCLRKYEIMKQVCLTVLLLCSLILLLPDCGKDSGSRLIGKWVVEEDPDILVMQFFKDGRVKSTYKEGVILEGNWQIQPNDTIEITIEEWDISAHFSGSRLVLRSSGKKKVYRKIK